MMIISQAACTCMTLYHQTTGIEHSYDLHYLMVRVTQGVYVGIFVIAKDMAGVRSKS